MLTSNEENMLASELEDILASEEEEEDILIPEINTVQDGAEDADDAYCIIHWNANGGISSIRSQVLECNTLVTQFPYAKRTGYTINGWWTKSSGGTQITEPIIADHEVTYYAHWEPIPCTISWDSDGGTKIEDAIKPYGESIGSLPSSKKDRCTLKGWYSESGERITSQTTVNGDSTFHAKWEQYTYFTQYDLGGHGMMPEDALESGTYDELLDYQPPEPIAPKGYRFEEWSVTDKTS